MRIDDNYPTPIHGVSTLSPRNRARGQAELQENFRSDPVNKLTRRQSAKWIKLIDDDITSDDIKYHDYRRDTKEFDIVVADNRIFAMVNKVSKTINNPNSIDISYLTTGSSHADIIAQTIYDTTILVNPKKTVLMEEVVDITPKASYVNVTSALNYGEVVTLTINILDDLFLPRKFVVTHRVPNLGTSPPNYDAADAARATAAVAQALTDKINQIEFGVVDWVCDEEGICEPVLGTGYGITAVSKGSVIAIRNTDETGNKTVTVEVLEGQGSKSCKAINDINSSIEGLPLYAIENSRVTIKPDPSSKTGTYYLNATVVSDITSADELQEVTWTESRKIVDNHKFVQNTLPLKLIYNNTNDTFTLDYMDLEERKTGDSETNKAPDFVNSKITAISYFQKRLVIVSENNVTMSKTDNLYNLFKKSSTQLFVTDPIGIASTYTAVDFIKHVVPHNKDLMFVANNGQFTMAGSIAITPETVSMPLSTSYNCITDVAPVSFGNSVLLPVTYGKSCGIQEYRREKNVDTDVAHPITNHIIGYMEGRPTNLVSNSNLEMAVMTTDESPANTLFVYEQYSEYGEHRQRSWSKWTLPENDRILGISFNNTIIKLIVREGNNLVFKEIELYAKVTTDTEEIFLDNYYEVAALNLFVLPKGYPWNENSVVVCSDRSRFPLALAVILDNTLLENGTRLVYVERETPDADSIFVVGERYSSRYTPTRPFRYTEDNIAITTDRVRISKYIVNVVNTSDLKCKIISNFYDTTIQEFNGRIVGAIDNILDSTPFFTGDVQFSFGQDAELAKLELYTDSYLNVTISGISWAGQYNKTSGGL